MATDSKANRISGRSLKALFLFPYALGLIPGQRYRAEQWIPYLRNHGVECDVLPMLTAEELQVIHSHCSAAIKVKALWNSSARALDGLRRARQYDVIWLYRTALLAGPPVIERLLAASNTPIVYDFDDAIWLTKTMASNQRLGFLKCAWKTSYLCRMARAVVTGNETLAEYAANYNRNIWIVPSTVDAKRYSPAPRNTDARQVVIGWSGSPTTVEDLQFISGAIQRVAARVPVEFRVMGGEVKIPGAPISHRRWSADREIDELRAFDIGIMPLPDDPWRRGKCAMKALLYMSVGVPTVASPVGVNARIIRDEQNGLLAATEDEWVDKLIRLVSSPDLRRRLGDAGRKTVEEYYTPEAQVPRILKVLYSVV